MKYLLLVLTFGLANTLFCQSTTFFIPLSPEARTAETPGLESSKESILRSRLVRTEMTPAQLRATQRIQLNLFEDTQFEVTLEQRPNPHTVNVDIYYGRTESNSIQHPDHYRDVIISVNRDNGKS